MCSPIALCPLVIQAFLLKAVHICKGNELTDAYFKVDAENGTLWALRGLPPRRHSLNISVTDGKFATFAQ